MREPDYQLTAEEAVDRIADALVDADADLQEAVEVLRNVKFEEQPRVKPSRRTTPTSLPVTREEALDDLVRAHGRGAECDLEEPLKRYVLMERDVRGSNGGPWLNNGDDAEELLTDSESQERPGDWPAVLLVDLDTSNAWAVTRRISLDVEDLTRPLDLPEGS